MTPVTMQVRIGRLVLDSRVASASQESIGEAIQTALASLLADGGVASDARGQAPNSLAATIATGIAGRLDTMSVRSQSATRSLPVSADTSHRVPRG